GNTTSFTSSAVSVHSGVYTVSSSHTYAEEGTYGVSVTINDAGGKSASESGTTSVADAALMAGTLTPPSATEGQAFNNVTVFTFSDADRNATASDYTAVVTLGDGNTVTLTSTPGGYGQIVANGNGFDVQLSYTYAEELT